MGISQRVEETGIPMMAGFFASVAATAIERGAVLVTG